MLSALLDDVQITKVKTQTVTKRLKDQTKRKALGKPSHGQRARVTKRRKKSREQIRTEAATSKSGSSQSWSAAEDSILVEVVASMENVGGGKINWTTIANKLNGRNPKQCNNRYTRLKRASVKIVADVVKTPVHPKSKKCMAKTTSTPATSGDGNSGAIFETPRGARSGRRKIWDKTEDRTLPDVNASTDGQPVKFDQVTQQTNIRHADI